MLHISKYFNNPFLLYALANAKGVLKWMPDEVHLKLMHRALIGRPLDLSDPKAFNEKLQWLKLHDRNPAYIELVDKYMVKQWVAERIGREHVLETYGVWESADNICWSDLPERFVLKTNHDCGGVVVCSDRFSFDIDKARRKLNSHLKTNYYWTSREWPYKFVTPLVFAEEYLGMKDKERELIDYKLLCFGGEVRCAFTCTGRSEGDLRVDFFDSKWNHLPFTRHYPNADVPPSAPTRLSEMIEYAQILSKDIPFVRVDFYELNDCIYFGEITFYPGGGFEEFEPYEWDLRLGEWIDLNLAIGR